MLKLIFLLLSLYAATTSAHGGGLDSSGGHNNRKTGGYHCHREPCLSTHQQVQSATKEAEVTGRSYSTLYDRDDWGGWVIKVTDGDTIIIETSEKKRHKIRLTEIDAPERDQPWGQQASRALSKKVMSKSIVAKVSGKDRYNRTLAQIFYKGRNINHEMVAEGHVWAYRRYLINNELLEIEQTAKDNRLGLWGLSESPIAPWEWRRGSR